MEKPNFERIADAMAGDWMSEQPLLPYLITGWENINYYRNNKNIEDGDQVLASFYTYPENDSLIDLLNDYNLIHVEADFKLLAWEFINTLRMVKLHQSATPKGHRESKLELLLALKLLLDNNKNGVSINFIRKQRVCGSIESSDLINIIKTALFEHFEKHDTDIYVARKRPELIRLKVPEQNEDWGKYIDLRIEQERYTISDLRKTKRKDANWLIKHVTYCLWNYLQKFTEIKAQDGSEYSNEQGRFIFRFLDIIGLIDDAEKIAKKEDVVGYYLKTYKKEIPIMSKFGPAKKFKHQ